MIIPEIKDILLKNGLKKGEIICIFSDIMNLGIPPSFKRKIIEKGLNYLLKAYIDTFKDVVKSEGIILMPTFTYSACKGEVFNVEGTKSTVGILTEYFRKQKDVKRSLHPIFSFAAWGKRAAKFLRIKDYDCFGENSIFGKLYKANAKYVLFGVDMQHGASFVYYSEQKLRVYYRHFKEFSGIIKGKNINLKRKIRYFVRNQDIKYEDYWHDLEKKAIEKEVIKISHFNGGNISIMNSREIELLIQEEVANNNNFLIRT